MIGYQVLHDPLSVFDKSVICLRINPKRCYCGQNLGRGFRCLQKIISVNGSEPACIKLDGRQFIQSPVKGSSYFLITGFLIVRRQSLHCHSSDI